jgi:predicted helicase
VAIPVARLDASEATYSNVTDWGLKQFSNHYKEAATPNADGKRRAGRGRKIGKEDVFHYCYAVLHDPIYREKYEQNLKRELPRIPFYEDFWQWAEWGEALMNMHVGYDDLEPYPLTRKDTPDIKARAAGQPPKVILRADQASGAIYIDSETTLWDVPASAWQYVLGNRSAIEWVLDQYKERKPKDETIAEKFDLFSFEPHKEAVIVLVARVARLSVDTMTIVDQMRSRP